MLLIYFNIYLRNCIENSKNQLKQIDSSNSLEFENHISWDFAEGVYLPYSSQQEVKFKYY